MAQWVNRLRNSIFVNPLPSPLLCEIFVALHLMQLGLMASRLVGRQADKIQVNLEFATDQYIRHFSLFNKCTASL